MKVVFFGATISALFTIPQEFSISYSNQKVKNYNYSDLELIANENKVPCYYIESSEPGKKSGDYYKTIMELKPDVILVMGWYYMVPKKIRELAKYGAWGIHASMLPDYAGGAPLVWAIINGEKETGITLFKLDDGVDDGDIIYQKRIEIAEEDSIKTVYEKVTNFSKIILLEALQNISTISFTPQDKSKLKIYPQRKPEDGEINWDWDAKRIKNFIRAQTKPYPGAFTIIKNKKVTIWDADIINLS
jgi:methionyl-tRNA formyltransferase